MFHIMCEIRINISDVYTEAGAAQAHFRSAFNLFNDRTEISLPSLLMGSFSLSPAFPLCSLLGAGAADL